jgi:hypothetical protein
MRSSILALLLIAVCVSAQIPAPAPAECRIAVPPTATRVNLDSLSRLAGDYELIQVSWQPAPPSVTRGHLHLAVPDSGQREVPCGLRTMRRDLVGWYQREGVAASARMSAVLDGRGVWIGSFCGFDGGGDVLAITAVSPHGFWGSWQSDLGIAVLIDTATHTLMPDPAGFFCALRKER